MISEEWARLLVVPRSMSVNSPLLTDARLSTLTEKYPMHVILRLISYVHSHRWTPGFGSGSRLHNERERGTKNCWRGSLSTHRPRVGISCPILARCAYEKIDQGFDHDESDDEWNEHIRWKYSAQAFEAPPLRRLDIGMDLVDMAIESLDIADGICVASTTERDLRENPLQPEQGGGDAEALGKEEGNHDPAEGCSQPREEDSSSDDEYLDWREPGEENEADIEVLEEAQQLLCLPTPNILAWVLFTSF